MFNPIIKEDVQEITKILNKDIYALEGKNILISGAAGMLASYIVYTLIYANENLFKKKTQLYLLIRKKIEPFGKKSYLHYLHIDVAKQKIKKIDFHYIIHAASKAAPKLYTKNLLDTINTNILGLYNLLNLVNKKTKSILYFSSGEVYGQLNPKIPINEKYMGLVDHLNQRSCYVEGKRVCETICMNYYWEKKTPVKIARIFHTFGPGLNLDDGRVFSDFIKDGLQKKDIEIKGNKNLIRPFLYIKDATVMLLKILLSIKNGEIYNLSNDKNLKSVEDLAKITCEIFNKIYDKKIKVKINLKDKQYYKYAVQNITPDITKFKKEFNYSPKTSVKKALEKTIKSLL